MIEAITYTAKEGSIAQDLRVVVSDQKQEGESKRSIGYARLRQRKPSRRGGVERRSSRA